MKFFYRYFLLPVLLLSLTTVYAQQIDYTDSWTNAGFNLQEQTLSEVEIIYSIERFSLDDINIMGEIQKKVTLPGHFLPNDEGAPDLPGGGSYIAIPQGSEAILNIVSMRTEVIRNIKIAPAPRIPKETDKGPLVYQKNNIIYSKNAYYPAEPIKLSEPTQIRGVDVVMLGITPFQYNPVLNELKIIRDIVVEVIFEGGNGHFGENRLRSRWFDPILSDFLINYASMPKIDYSKKIAGSRDTGCEYLIISSDDSTFLAWADSLKVFRNMQGILTDVVTTTAIGGNDANTIETYINDAYFTWDIPPVAVLIFADFGILDPYIMAPIWNSYCASDHIYADVDNNGMADIILARITAQNATHLENMVGKVLDHERTPPTDPGFYDHPITALGWQTERWFQICTESIGGYFANIHGKTPVRINEIYDGDPSVDPWSTAPNTGTILNVFGPNGLGYIPATPAVLGGWTGGNATMVNNAIDSGAFILQHRDHGGHTGWGEPPYHNSDIDNLTNDEYCFVFSINCLTGKYNWSDECFAEKFHRSQHGALGIIAASEVSYSFVNDTYVWGIYDYLWTDFLPSFGANPEHRGLYPAFGNAAGKYFLQQSQWPYNTGSKEVTYNLFHHHGCAFTTLYSELPQNLTVIHDNVLLGGVGFFNVQADSGSFIALSVNGTIIGTADGTGYPVQISIEPQIPGIVVDVVVTKTNYLRYNSEVTVISPDIPFVIFESYDINDVSGNNNGLLDYADSILLSLTLENVGNIDAENVSAILRTDDVYITITDSTADYGNIPAHQTAVVNDGYSFDVSESLPDGRSIKFDIFSTDGDSIWYSNFFIPGHAPILAMEDRIIEDPAGNGNGRIDPGETVDIVISIANNGSSEAYNVLATLSGDGEYITINNNIMLYGTIAGGDTAQQSYSVTADPSTPGGYNASFHFNMDADLGITTADSFNVTIGRFSALVLDLDPNHNTGPVMQSLFENMELFTNYFTTFPEDLNDYKSIFACLGIIFTGHQLTESEAQKLAEYLNNGGNLYLEGRRTWYDDPQTSLHPMFNIDVVHDTWFEYDTIFGIAGTFTESMIFDVDGASPYNDYYMEPVSPAFNILESPEPGYICAVAYDEGNYKTIGVSFEFGSLVDDNYPSTKENLLIQILDFFGGIITGDHDEAGLYEPVSTLINYPNPFGNYTNILFSLKESEKIQLEIYNLNGQKIGILCDKELEEGSYRFVWDGKDQGQNSLPGGIYICKLSSGKFILTRKIILVE